MTDMKARAQAEVVELHRFFQDWFNGDLCDADEVFSRFEGVVASSFHMVSPDGRLMSRDTVMARVRAGHASARSPHGGRIKIWIENADVRWLNSDLVLVTYEEWQSGNGRTRGRLSTALLHDAPSNPNALEWLHVHETWLPEP